MNLMHWYSIQRFTFYLMISIVGFLVLRRQPQYNDLTECFRNWPHHPITDEVFWYYMVQAGLYWSLLLSTFIFDVRRSDFWQMMLHHAVTILLLSMSWTINFVRVGSLLLFIHDLADILL